MNKFDTVCLWIKQILLDIQVTINNALEWIFDPLYGLVDMINRTVHQWATKPEQEEEEKEENKHKQIGFGR